MMGPSPSVASCASVAVRPGVTVLRLAEIVGTSDDKVHVRLQVSDPKVDLSVGDMLAVCLPLFLVFGFGATEQNRSDVFAFPRGMHPVVVGGQIATLALYTCFLIAYVGSTRSSHIDPGLPFPC